SFEEFRYLARFESDLHSCVFEGCDFRFGCPSLPGDDRTCVPHALSWWGGTSSNIGGDWLWVFGLPYVFCSHFFGVTSNFADHRNRLCCSVLSEHFKDVYEAQTYNWVTPNSEAGGLPKAGVGEAGRDFVC